MAINRIHSTTAAGLAVVPLFAPGVPPLDPATVLQWTSAAVAEWLRQTCFLREASPELHCLQRLSLTGRVLLMRPAASLRERLFAKQRELYPDADRKLLDALEAILDTLDDEVAVLVTEAIEKCEDAAVACQIHRLYDMRFRSVH
eukprot:tig00000093_g3629.t1